jgi:hypothetical protein
MELNLWLPILFGNLKPFDDADLANFGRGIAAYR